MGKNRGAEREDSRKAGEMRNAILRFWEESEAGWGCRPDGVSLHKSTGDAKQYETDYWKTEKEINPSGITPHEYSRPCGSLTLVSIPTSLFKRIKGNGLRLWQHEWRNYDYDMLDCIVSVNEAEKKRLARRRKPAKK